MSDKRPAPSKTSAHKDIASSSSRDEIDAFLNSARNLAPRVEGQGRLLFALDATMSRQPTWDRACSLQAEMFEEAAKIGGLDVQLIYFRGFGECRASKWVRDARALGELMTKIDCRGGHTQIGKVLRHALKETQREKIQAIVYIGDCMEEDIDDLCARAGELSLLGVPIFVFQDGGDIHAERGFRDIARLTKGVYLRLDNASAKELGALLRGVAAYAAGGRKALADLSKRGGTGATLLLKQMS